MTDPLPAAAPARCPVCRHELDGASTIPRPGDWTVCRHGAALLVFEEGLTWREVTAEETVPDLNEEDRLFIRYISRLIKRHRLQD